MKHVFAAALAIAGILILFAIAPAHALGMCGARADFLKALSDKYQETGKALGIAGHVNLVEIFTSKAGTWTILITQPNGQSCIVAAGSSWEELPPAIEGTDS